jgi:hypothetical protein
MCVLIFSTKSSEIFLILRKIQRDIKIMDICFRVRYPVSLSEFNQT